MPRSRHDKPLGPRFRHYDHGSFAKPSKSRNQRSASRIKTNSKCIEKRRRMSTKIRVGHICKVHAQIKTSAPNSALLAVNLSEYRRSSATIVDIDIYHDDHCITLCSQ